MFSLLKKGVVQFTPWDETLDQWPSDECCIVNPSVVMLLRSLLGRPHTVTWRTAGTPPPTNPAPPPTCLSVSIRCVLH